MAKTLFNGTTLPSKNLPTLNGVQKFKQKPTPLKLNFDESQAYYAAGKEDPFGVNKNGSTTLSLRQKVFLRKQRAATEESPDADGPENEYIPGRNADINNLPFISDRSRSRPRNQRLEGQLSQKDLQARSRNSIAQNYTQQATALQSRSTVTLRYPQSNNRSFKQFNHEVPTKKALFSGIIGMSTAQETTQNTVGLVTQGQQSSSSTFDLGNSKIFKSLYAVQSCDITPLKNAQDSERTQSISVQKDSVSVIKDTSVDTSLSPNASSTLQDNPKSKKASKGLFKQQSFDAGVQAYINYQQKKQERIDREIVEKRKAAQLRNWIQWGEPSQPLSDYQQMQDSFKTFSQNDISVMKRLSNIANTNLKSLATKSKIKLTVEKKSDKNKAEDSMLDNGSKFGRKLSRQISVSPTKGPLVPKEHRKLKPLSSSKKTGVSFSQRDLKNVGIQSASRELKRKKSLGTISVQSLDQVTENAGPESILKDHVKDHLKDTKLVTINTTEKKSPEQQTLQRKQTLSRKNSSIPISNLGSKVQFQDNSSDDSAGKGGSVMQQLKAGFLKRFDFGMQAFLRSQRYNQGYMQATKYEQNYLKTILTTPWKSTKLLSKTKDEDRVRVLEFMTQELKEILQLVGERNFTQPIDRMHGLLVACKLLSDPKPTIYAYQMYSCLLLHNDYAKEASTVLEVAKDLAHETQNLAQEMVCYELIGKVLQVRSEFRLAKIAFKKMLQLAWMTRITDYEYRAYTEIAKQYFYLQRIDKSREYHMKALNGELEKLDNPERLISEEQYRKKQNSETKMGKYERMGCKVDREGHYKVIDHTQDYAKVYETIDRIYSKAERLHDDPLIENKLFAKKMVDLKNRKVGQLLIRLGTPLSQMSDEVHSPRVCHEKVDSPMKGNGGNGLNTTTDSQMQVSQSPPRREARPLFRTKPKQSPDYLLEMRAKREYDETERNKTTIEFQEIKAKAQLRRVVQNKHKVQLRHLAYTGKLLHNQQSQQTALANKYAQDVKQSTFHSQKVQALKMKQMSKKEKSEAEIEAIEHQRKLARDANKTEQVQKEVNTFGYPLLEYLRKMKTCSYRSLGEKTSRFGTNVQFFFYSDKNCQQVHDLLLF